MLGTEVLDLNGHPINWEKARKWNPAAIVKWSKRTTGGKEIRGSLRTICFLERLNRRSLERFGVGTEIIQGCYNIGVEASAGTHNLDAVVDYWIPGVDPWTQQRFGRANGMGVWYRHPPTFGQHQHGFVLPPSSGPDHSRDFDRAGLAVGVYVDGGWSTEGSRVTSSQIEDFYNHAFGLSEMHTPGSDRSWFPGDIKSTIFDLDTYIETRIAQENKETEIMTSVRNIEVVTATTDSNGDILDYDVTNGGHWEVIGVFPAPNDAYSVIVRPWPVAGSVYKYNFRVFKRAGDGTIVPDANRQVRFSLFVGG